MKLQFEHVYVLVRLRVNVMSGWVVSVLAFMQGRTIGSFLVGVFGNGHGRPFLDARVCSTILPPKKVLRIRDNFNKESGIPF